MKSVQIGARISHADAEFLSQLEVEGARTPSDKLRAIIEEARLRRRCDNDFRGSYKEMVEQLAPALEVIKTVEFETSTHSEIMARVGQWMPDFYAFFLSSVLEGREENTPLNLEKVEAGVTEMIFLLFQSVMQMGVSRQCSCYNPDLINEHLQAVSELAEVAFQKRISKGDQ